MKLDVKVKDIIYKDIGTVFNAIVNKNEITKYFVTHADNNITQGAKIAWEWKDFNASSVVHVIKVENNKQIIFTWEGNNAQTEVEILFKAVEENKTALVITEKSFNKDDEGIKKVMQQTQGWTDFSCSLKAYLYTGINLRNGKRNE